ARRLRAPAQGPRRLACAGGGCTTGHSRAGARSSDRDWSSSRRASRACLARGISRACAHPRGMKLRAFGPGTVNLCLLLGPLRADGRHELVTLIESVSLADELHL